MKPYSAKRAGALQCILGRPSLAVVAFSLAFVLVSNGADAQPLNPDAVATLERQASALYAEDDLSGAATSYLELAERSTNETEGGRFAVIAAWIHHQDEDIPERDNALRIAVGKHPDIRPDPSAYSADFLQRLQAIRIEVETTRSNRAISLTTAAQAAVEANKPDQAIQLYQELMELQPERHAVRLQLAVIQLNAGKPSAAAATLAPFSADLALLDPDTQQRTMSLMALARIRSGSLDGISTEIRRVTGKLQRQLWLELASSYERQGLLESAVAAYGSVLEIEPADRQTAILHSRLLSRLGRQRDAESFLINLSETLPASSSVWHELGQVREAMNDNPGAAVAYRRAAELEPTDSVDHEGKVLALVASARLNRDSDPTAASAAIGTALDLYPQRVEPIAMHGRLLSDQDRHEEAIAQVKKAVSMAPDRIDLRNLLGNSHYLAGQYQTAVEVFERLLVDNPELNEVRANLELARSLIADQGLTAEQGPRAKQGGAGPAANASAASLPAAPTRRAWSTGGGVSLGAGKLGAAGAADSAGARREERLPAAETNEAPGAKSQGTRSLALGLELSPFRWSQTGRNVIRVERVELDSKASRCGLEAGDLMIRVGGASTASSASVERAMRGDTTGLRLDIVRADRPMALVCI